MGDCPTYASVTDVACTCKYLERAAIQPDEPIVFDRRTGEYQFRYTEPNSDAPSMLIIYHCPFCGGAAPRSQRERLFQVISRAESDRLKEMLMRVQTVDDAKSVLGTPDVDNPFGAASSTDESETSPSGTKLSRTLTYRGLSNFADVIIEVRADGSLSFSLQGKSIGG